MQNLFSLFTVSLIFCNMIHLFEETFFSRALFEKMSKGGAGGVAANFKLFSWFFINFFPEHFLKGWAREGRGEQQLMFSSWRKMKTSEKKKCKSSTKSTTKWTIYIFLAIENSGKWARDIFSWLGLRRQEQALQEAFRRADNNSEGKLSVDDYLKVK